jgi:acetyl-CoA carboxylase biotin carboxylase subunit
LKAIDEYKIEGVQTTLPFGKFVFEHEAFRSGDFDTHFVKKYYDAAMLKKQQEDEAHLAALLALQQYLKDQKIVRLPIV